MTAQAFLVDIATGETIQRVTSGSTISLQPDEGQAVIGYMGDEDIETLETFLDGTLQLRARTIDPALVFSIAKIEMREALRRRRDRAEFSGCDTPLGRMDTDADSQRKVNGSVTMALIAQAAGQPFAIDWTMADNSSVTHDAAAMIAAGVAVGLHVSACHANGVALKAAIDAATDVVELAAVDIEEGWP
jgi:hypothetical protein